MALEDIRKKIIADAEAQKKELLATATKHADLIIAESKKQAEAYKEDQHKKAQSSAENLERGLVIDARRSLANQILAKKRSRLEQVFVKAEKEFCSTSGYPELIKNLILKVTTTKKESIVIGKDEKNLNDKWLSELNSACGGSFSFASERGDFVGGVILQDGDTSVNITIEILFSLLKNSVENSVADILFKG